ncbi:acyltransferase family protein [Hoeflea sp. AS16]|uniref:acyltransferase family protein n=1 Tax=Hoeflea sp. AS16 TaxID=3135779 RepID=UPI00317C248D
MKYRAEIDGLRALAVVPVILFHAGFELFGGGFVGVDIFFVISGYLITTILVEDIENKRFSIVKFYERRARRILPALFFVMLVCIPFAWMWMIPSEMKDFSKSLVAVSLFASNILFWKQTGYFAADSDEKPLLHTWSLAVEEQYYLLFPVFLIFAWRFGKNRVFWTIVAMAAVSLMLSEWGWRSKSSANFYLAHTRAWELFAGSISAFVVQRRGVQHNNVFAITGLAAIVFSIFAYDERTPFPSVYALVPVLGVVLLILYAQKDTLPAKLLSTRAFVGVGLISYSAYLWHQPLFAFARIRLLGETTDLIMLTLSALSILLAFLSWRYVEKPFRADAITTRRHIRIGTLTGFIAFVSIGLVGIQQDGFGQRLDKFAGWSEFQDIASVGSTHCHNAGRRTAAQLRQADFCVIGEGEAEVAIIGDSHAGALFEAANGYLIDSKKSAIAASGGYCAPLLNGFEAGDGCNEVMELAINHAISSQTIKTIIIAAEWANYTSGYRLDDEPGLWRDDQGAAVRASDNVEIFRRSFALTFDALSRSNKHVLILLPVPEFSQDSYDWVGHQLLFDRFADAKAATSNLPPISVSEYEQRNDDVLTVFSRHTAQNVSFVPMTDLFCDINKCRQFSADNKILYSDFNHVNYYGAQLIVQKIADNLNYE